MNGYCHYHSNYVAEMPLGDLLTFWTSIAVCPATKETLKKIHIVLGRKAFGFRKESFQNSVNFLL